MKWIRCTVFLLLAGVAAAQEPVVFRLNYVVREMEGSKSISTHSHTMLVSPDTNATLRIGSKVPVPTAPNSQQYSYVDVGVNLRAKVQERGSQLLLNTDIEISNLGAERENTGRPAPQIQQIRANLDTAVVLGKATPVVMLDDPASPRRYEIEVTANKLK